MAGQNTCASELFLRCVVRTEAGTEVLPMYPYLSPVVLAAVVVMLLCLSQMASAQGLDPNFRPELAGAEFSSREVRPGDMFSVTLKFRNSGTQPAKSDYHVFLHFEAPTAECTNICIHADHAPTQPTSSWQPGQTVVDGPTILTAPDALPEQEYFVHVGLYDVGGTGERLLDTYDAGKIRITRTAPASDTLAPKPLPAEEVAKRRQALASRLASANLASLDTPTCHFDLDRESGVWALADKSTGVLWTSDPRRPEFGQIELRKDSRRVLWTVRGFGEVTSSARLLHLVTHPLVDGKPSGTTVTFAIEPMADPAGLKFSYTSEVREGWTVTRVRLLQDALCVTEEDDGRLYVPNRLGIELRADQDLPGVRQFRTYNTLSMSMCGAVKQGSALLLSWDNVDTDLTVNTSWQDAPLVPGARMRAISLDIAAPSGSCTIHPLGKGDYVEIAQAYRLLAKVKGWLLTWAEKRKQYPNVNRLFGASNFKPFVLSRVLPTSRFSPDRREHVRLGFTFEEVAQCAEHWRRDLGIDRAFVVLAGWINGGYDVRHPDILPAAPECGGNEGLQKAAQRIRACGYLFGLHDNYQDMYEDAPSWGLEWLNKNQAGKPKQGGNWNGGQAWQVCAIKQVELAERPETNLPKVAELFAPTIYFIDTVFAWPLVTCEDPAHPMTRADDLQWKTRLCLLAKKYFGLFGSEEGREWGVPCADYLEGIFSHQTSSAPGTVIPLFPLVYSDCVQIMTHQNNRIGPGDEKEIADHLLYAEMPLHSFGQHLYWTAQQPAAGVPLVPLPPRIRDLGGRKFEITYRWRVDGKVAADYSVFVHFTHKAATRPEGIAFQDDHAPPVPISLWEPGSIVEYGPHVVEVPPEFNGPSDINLGMLAEGNRVTFANVRHSGLRYRVGTLTTTDEGITFVPVDLSESQELWSRGDGWGKKLCATDRVIKNTWEVLSPLNLLTAETPMTDHEFLSDDRLLQRTRFGDVTITVSYEKPARIGDNAVPAYGFIIDSPTYVAFCATRYNGLDYTTPTLFTARSLDGKPLAESSRVRVYHGFGDPRLRLGDKTLEVATEQVVSLK